MISASRRTPASCITRRSAGASPARIGGATPPTRSTGSASTTSVSLTVLSVGYALAPVGPDAVGGAEQVLSALDRALVAAGHSSLVVAPEGSQVAGHLIATAKLPAHITDRERSAIERRQRAAIEQALRERPDRSDPCPRARFRRAPARNERPDADHPAPAGRVLSDRRRSPTRPQHLVSLRLGGPAASFSAASATCSTRYRTACRSIACGRGMRGAISPWRSGASARKRAFIWRSTRLGWPGCRC